MTNTGIIKSTNRMQLWGPDYYKGNSFMLEIILSDSNKATYKYRQVYEILKEKIISGQLPRDYKLPSKRELAKDLNISINSVTTAYEQLIAEGYVYSLEKKGYYIVELNAFMQENTNRKKLKESLIESRDKKRYNYSLSHMTTNSLHFPHKKWISYQRQVIKEHQYEISQLSHPQGPIEVRKAIRDLVKITRGINCYAEQIVIGTGTQPLIDQLVDLFKSDIKAGIENPGYARVRDMLIDKGINVTEIPLDNNGADLEAVKKENPTLQFLTPSHQFPTGIIMPISRRIDLLNWASEKENRYIVEDDYDSEFKYGTDNIPSLHSLDKEEKVIYIGTFSKTLLPSFRMTYMILPIYLLELYKAKHKNWLQGNNSIQLYTLKYFIESGEYSRHVKKMNLHYEHNRDALIISLKKHFKNKVEIADIPAGLHFTAKFKTQKSYDEIKTSAEKYSLELYDMRRFSTDYVSNDDEWKEYVLGFASLEIEEIDNIVKILYKAVSD